LTILYLLVEVRVGFQDVGKHLRVDTHHVVDGPLHVKDDDLLDVLDQGVVVENLLLKSLIITRLPV